MAPSSASLVSGSSDLTKRAGPSPAQIRQPRRRVSDDAVAAGLDGPILIRRSKLFDAPALRRLASLDSRKLPEGRFLVAELGREIVAAAPLETEAPALADPFRPTADLRHFLERQARSIRARMEARTDARAA
jgi:hypothetical protein